MYSRYRFLTLGIPLTQSLPSHVVNAAKRLAEGSWRGVIIRGIATQEGVKIQQRDQKQLGGS